MSTSDHAGHEHGPRPRTPSPASAYPLPGTAAYALCPAHGPGVPVAELRARSAAVRRVFWITLFLNFGVAAAKGAYAWSSGSVTLGADAFHSVLDGAANVLALVGLHFSAAPVDAGHPYGHRKFEIVAALAVGVLITVSLFEVGAAAVDSLRGQRPAPDVDAIGFAVVLGTMAINYFVSRYEHRKGEELQSPLLAADARHTHADLYASGAVLLSFVAARLGVPRADGVGGLVLVVMVARVAWNVFSDNIPSLVDTAILDPARVREIGLGIPGVAGVHGIRSRGTKWAVELDLHVQVARDMKVEHAHGIAHQLEDAVRAQVPQLLDVVVHIEPLPDAGAAPPHGDPTSPPVGADPHRT